MPPKHLYKFERLNEQTLRNLKNAQIYFNTPASFNDPFDCSVLEASAVLDNKNVFEIFEHYINEKNIQLDFEINSIDDIPKKYINQIRNCITQAFKEQQYKWLYKTGCTCFSEEKEHILLWSHYADGHKGICLEFDTSFDPFPKAMKVNYSYNFPLISPMRLLDESDEFDDETMKPLLTKYECWDYEREWRLFHHEPNKPYGYPVDALKAVYFGSAVHETDVEIVCLILQGQSKNIKFYKAFKDNSSYCLRFEEFTYTPYINKT